MADWTVVVPVKPLAAAKSRLHPPAVVERQLLVMAMLSDVIAAVSTASMVARLIVLTCDPTIARMACGQGAEAMREPWPTGLNTSIGLAARRVADHHPFAVVTADLPSLRTRDLEHVLHAAGQHDRGYVTDVQETGTTILTASSRLLLEPRFGPQSAIEHASAGHRLLIAPASARRDVDTWEDLVDALRLGVGGHTSAALGPGSARAANRLIAPLSDTTQETGHGALAG